MVSEFLQVGAGLVLVVGGVAGVVSARAAVRRAVAVATADRVDPARPTGAFGRLDGTADVAEHLAEAPFTGRDAIAYDCAVEQEGDEMLETNAVRTETGAVPFRLSVDGRTVNVVPVDATVELRRETTVDVPGGEEPPERIEAYNERVDLSPQHTPVDAGVVELSRGWDRTYHEGVVAPGEAVTVYGRLHTPERPDPEVDAVVDDGAPAFLVTDYGPVGAAVRAEWDPLRRAVLALAALVVGAWTLVVALG